MNLLINKKDYESYINNEITLNDISKKYGCTYSNITYQLKLFCEKNNLPNKRQIIKQNRIDNYFDKIDTRNKAYILGFFLADGCISNNRLSFSQIDIDSSILYKIRNEIVPNSNHHICEVKSYKNKKTGYISKSGKLLSIHSIHICKTLIKYFGLRKTYSNLSIKNIIPENLMWDFIRGYFDGDGCISFSHINRKLKLKDGTEKIYHNINKQWFIISHTQNLLNEICEFMKKYDINTYVIQEKRGFNYLINTSSYKEIKKIYNNLYYVDCICLERKKNKFEDLIKEMEYYENTK